MKVDIHNHILPKTWPDLKQVRAIAAGPEFGFVHILQSGREVFPVRGFCGSVVELEENGVESFRFNVIVLKWNRVNFRRQVQRASGRNTGTV